MDTAFLEIRDFVVSNFERDQQRTTRPVGYITDNPSNFARIQADRCLEHSLRTYEVLDFADSQTLTFFERNAVDSISYFFSYTDLEMVDELFSSLILLNYVHHPEVRSEVVRLLCQYFARQSGECEHLKSPKSPFFNLVASRQKFGAYQSSE